MTTTHNHHEAKLVLGKPVRITAGSSQSQAPIQGIRLYMAGSPKPVIEGLPGYKPIHVRIDWPDMGTPAMDEKDWLWLAGKLRALKRPIHVSCMMGHGRTGTALVLLAHCYRAIPSGMDPVKWVREAYCPDAVETWEQIRYIEKITGRKSECEPSQVPLPPYGGVGGRYRYDDWSMAEGWKPAPKLDPKPTYTGTALDDVTSLTAAKCGRPVHSPARKGT